MRDLVRPLLAVFLAFVLLGAFAGAPFRGIETGNGGTIIGNG